MITLNILITIYKNKTIQASFLASSTFVVISQLTLEWQTYTTIWSQNIRIWNGSGYCHARLKLMYSLFLLETFFPPSLWHFWQTTNNNGSISCTKCDSMYFCCGNVLYQVHRESQKVLTEFWDVIVRCLKCSVKLLYSVLQQSRRGTFQLLLSILPISFSSFTEWWNQSKWFFWVSASYTPYSSSRPCAFSWMLFLDFNKNCSTINWRGIDLEWNS